MAGTINKLSISIKIGSHDLILQTDTIPSAQGVADLAKGYATQLKDMMLGLSFKMEEGKVILVAVEDFLNAMGEKIGEAGVGDLRKFFNEIAGATEGINIHLWGLEFTTSKMLKDANATPARPTDKGKLSFAFHVRVNLTADFYNNISVPKELTNLIALNSLGIGVKYDKEFNI